MKWKLLLICLLVYSCSHSGSKNEQELEQTEISLDVKTHKLKNGLKILVVENNKLPIFSYYSYYKVGGKYEVKGMTGASHYLEHMMFKGAKKYGPGDFDKIVEGNGGSNNAYTTNDLTVYYENLPSEHINTIIDLEADRMQNLLLEPVSFESERMVVLEERKMRYENRDQGKLFLSMMLEMFEGTPYGTSVIGDVEDIKTVSREAMIEYFKEFYAPNNAVMVIVGDVKAKDVFKEIEKRFGDIKSFKDLEKKKAEYIKVKGDFDFKWNKNKEIKLHGTSKQPSFILAFKGVKLGHEDSFALDLFSSILGMGESSYLEQQFVKGSKPSLSSIYAANYTLVDSGVFFIGGELLHNTSLKTFENNLRRALIRSCDEAILERNLQKVKNSYLVSSLSSLDTNAGVARFIGDREVYYGDYNFYKREMKIYDQVTIEDLKRVCKKYITNDESIFLSIWNKHKAQ